MQGSQQSENYSTDQNNQTSDSTSNIRFEYNTRGLKEQINLNEDEFIGFLNDILIQNKNGGINEKTKNRMKDIFPFLEDKVPVFMDVNIFLPEKKEIENLNSQQSVKKNNNIDLLSFQNKKNNFLFDSKIKSSQNFEKKINEIKFIEPIEENSKTKKLMIFKPNLDEDNIVVKNNFEKFQKLEKKSSFENFSKKNLNISNKESFNIFNHNIKEPKNVTTKKLFIPNINKNNNLIIKKEEKKIGEKNLYSFNDFTNNNNNINFKDYKRDVVVQNNNFFSSKELNEKIFNNFQENISKDKINFSSTLKKLKYYWRGTNQNYPYAFKKVKKHNINSFSDYQILESIDISQKIINKKEFEDFTF